VHQEGEDLQQWILKKEEEYWQRAEVLHTAAAEAIAEAAGVEIIVVAEEVAAGKNSSCRQKADSTNQPFVFLKKESGWIYFQNCSNFKQ